MVVSARMRPVFLVKQEEADLARQIESRLLGLPLNSGILFVGVSVVPAVDEKKVPSVVYRIWVGCHRDFDEGLIKMVVRHALLEELEKGLCIEVEVHRGIGRAPVAKVVDTAG